MFTQAVDRKDSTLGVFHRWIEELSKRFEKVTVCTLRTGEIHLPENVEVVSLRPWISSDGVYIKSYWSSLRTAWRVLVEACSRRHEYDAVFVHMNQEYLLVAGWLWVLLRKKVFFWRNHYAGNIWTDIAAFFATRVFCTSKFSYTTKYAKNKLMPVGVDVGSCNLDEEIERIPNSILFLARFDISKRPHVLVNALEKLKKENIPFTASFVGGVSGESSDSEQYQKDVHEAAHTAGLDPYVQFVGAVPNTETYRYYRSHDIYVNCARSGMLDKTIFKAIACGCYALSSSGDMAEIAGEKFVYADGDADALATLLKEVLSRSFDERRQDVSFLQKEVVEPHRLDTLMDRLVVEMGA